MLSRVWAARGVLNVARAAHIPRSRPLFNPSVSQRSIAYKVPMRDVRFLLHELNDTKKHYAGLKNSGGEDASPEMVESILDEFSKFAEEVLVPINEGGDQVGCKQIGPNEVKTPPGFKEAYDQFVEGGWQGMSFPQKWGGLGLPASLQLFTSEMTATACWTWTMFPGLSKGAINTLLAHGDDFVQGKYLPQLVSGEWSGTMCLTEPQCGSDLAQVATKAVPIEGTNKYKISGTKIFISCGEHDLTSNIIHCVLARLPDAPKGIKGISLFAVPKFKVEDDGTLTSELNGATIGRIENKMGCHGSPTCEINFENAVGEIIGVPHKGMRQMFTFINTSRLGTAVQGLAAMEGSFQNALAYCKERGSMRALSGTKEPNKVADPIIVHPSVRSMLLTQKCFAEGGRSMVYDCALLADEKDEAIANGDLKKAEKIDSRLGFLTPILKGFLTEAGNESAYLGIQAFGGHGYIQSNGQEQIARDVRISSVWEGTTQIQALDLLGRKIMLEKMKPLTEHCSRLRTMASGMLTNPGSTSHGKIRSHAFEVYKLAWKWQITTTKIAMYAAKNKEYIGLAAEPYLMMAGYITLAEHWLRMENVAAKALGNSGLNPKEKDFYEGKVKAAAFYFDNVLPRVMSLSARMLADERSTMSMTPSQFAYTDDE